MYRHQRYVIGPRLVMQTVSTTTSNDSKVRAREGVGCISSLDLATLVVDPKRLKGLPRV